jgi:prolyl oligopeptidase
VRAGTKYPAVLIESADSDDRVDPMHARKLAAALQAASASGRPILLRVERNASHGGSARVDRDLDASADAIAFLMDAVGLRYPIAR